MARKLRRFIPTKWGDVDVLLMYVTYVLVFLAGVAAGVWWCSYFMRTGRWLP